VQYIIVYSYIKERIDKWTYMKLKSFFIAKEMVTRLKRHYRMGENLFYTPDKGLITRIYQELKKTNLSKNQQPTE
jgi:hypothetical protein